MKVALKTFICLVGVFVAYYTYFLGSVYYDLFGPHAYWCGTGSVWALQAAAILVAPPALACSVGLWFAGRPKRAIGIGFSRASRVEIVILILCVLANSMVFIPSRTV